MGTYFLTAAELASTRTKLAKLNARAARRGFTGRIDLHAVRAERSITTPSGSRRTLHGYDVEVLGEPPRYEGWTFVAAVDKTSAGAVIRTAPGAPAVENCSIEAGICEHCGTARYRRHTYLVLSASGELKQVGKTCLKDFLGWDTTPVFIDEEALEEELLSAWSSQQGRSFDYDLLDVARIAFALTDRFGYKSAQALGASTKSEVLEVLHHGKGAEELLDQLEGHILDDEQVDSRLEVVRQSLTQPDGFEANLAAILAGEVVEHGHLGLAATVGLVYNRAVGAREVILHESQWLGTVGERLEVSGKVTMVREIAGYYGTTLLVGVSVGAGDRVKMFTTAAWADAAEVGDQVRLAGVVKAHEEYEGKRETVLKRPKMLP